MLNDDINIFLGTFSYPFVSIDFLFNDYLQNYCDLKKYSLNDKIILRKKLCDFINKRYSIYNYDEIYLYLDKWYLYPRYDSDVFNKKFNSFDIIFKHLMDFTTSFISQRDGKIIYKYWDNEKDDKFLGGFSKNNKIYLFHSINRLIPLDILVVLYMLKNGKEIEQLDGCYGNIEVSDSLLDKYMEKGVSENHLHKGVSVSFLTSWDEYMKLLTEKSVQKLIKIENDSNDFYDIRSKNNMYLLLLANLIRNFLSVYISIYTKDCLNYKEVDNTIAEIKSYFIKTFLYGDLDSQIRYFCYGNKEPDISKWEYFLQKSEKLKFYIDKLRFYGNEVFKEKQKIMTSDENLFLFSILDKIYNSSSFKDGDFSKNLFLNYLRIKNHFYQLVVQQKTVHGLNFFQEEFYHVNSKFSNWDVPFDWKRALREQFQNRNLKKLELRASIGQNESLFKKEVNRFLKNYLEVLHDDYCSYDIVKGEKIYKPVYPFPRVGLVFHLLKKEQFIDFANGELKSYSDDEVPYKKLYKKYESEIRILNDLRNQNNVYNKYLLGIDVASLENAVPTWVYTHIFEKARDSKNEKLSLHSDKNQSLCFTFHAGEDFRHVFSGLRRIYEVIEYLKFHAGDRIGHGVVLGVDIKNWHLHNRTIIIPRIEALENYIWLYDLLSNNYKTNDTFMGNLDFVENRIYKLSKEIYGIEYPLSVNLLVDAYKEIFRRNIFVEDNFDKSLFESYFKENKKDNNFIWDIEKLIASRRISYFLNKMYEPIHMQVDDNEIRLAEVAREIVKDRINEKGIIIEINPSSNVVIGDLDTIKENQVYSINNNGYEFDNMIVCINSDDPAIFNTNAANELGYIYFGMLERKANRQVALEWVDKLRENGMKSSFIRCMDSDEMILSELEQFVKYM